jgi:starch-binding outer membrane protein SusE/F
MKYLLKLGFCLLVLTTFFMACEKVENLPTYKNGTAPVLNSSVTSIAPTPADSSNIVVSFSWTNPKYATDSSTVKYVVEIDSSGRNFSKAVSIVMNGRRDTSLTGKQINGILLGNGFSFGVAYPMDVRVISSYANNNDQQISNTLTIPMTPYKIPPKIAPPASGTLFLVGSATKGGWNNPVPVPTQQFNKLDSVTYGGVFDLSAGNEYLVLPVNGDWTHKYSVADKTLSGLNAGGDFGLDLKDNIPGPSTSGKYIIILDFQGGKFTVTPYSNVLPDSLFMVGDATPGGWTNPVPVPSQQFTRMNSSLFEITVPITGGKQYLMLPVNGSWTHKFSVADNSIPGLAAGGNFGYDLSSNFPGPSADGSYKIDVDFLNYTFTVVKQ